MYTISCILLSVMHGNAILGKEISYEDVQSIDSSA